MAAAATTRDGDAAGLKAMPAARTQDTTALNEWKATWAITNTSMDTWKTKNTSSAGDSYTWWVAARDVSVAVNAWWEAYGAATSATDSALNAEEEVKYDTNSDGTADGQTMCDVTTTASDWTNNTANTVADCKTACTDLKSGLFGTTNDTANPTVVNGGATFAKFKSGAAAVTTWCGAISWNEAGTANVDRCKIMTGKGTAVSKGSAGDAADRCYKFTTITALAAAQADLVAKLAVLEGGSLSGTY